MAFLQLTDHQILTSHLQDFIRADNSSELFIDQNGLNDLFTIMGKIAEEGNAFLVTTDPFDAYQLSLVDFRAVASIICSCISRPADLRIFGGSWGVGLSSYSANDAYEGVEPLPLHALEIKLLLAGSATDWMDGEA